MLHNPLKATPVVKGADAQRVFAPLNAIPQADANATARRTAELKETMRRFVVGPRDPKAR